MNDIASKATVSEATIAQKLKEIAAAEATAQDGREWVAAARRVLGHKVPVDQVKTYAVTVGNGAVSGAAGKPAKTKATRAPRTPRTTGFTATVEAIVNGASEPMTKADLKAALKSQGVDDNKLGPYFYTTLTNLKKANRIVVLADGRVAGAPTAAVNGSAGVQQEAQAPA